jgi:hypothetical protein
MSLGLYNARSCRVRDQHRIRARNQDSEIAAEEIRDRGMGFSDSERRANSQPHCHSIGNGYAATDANTQSWAISKATPHASAAAIVFTEPRVF